MSRLRLREAEHIKRASLGGEVRQVFHRVDEAERAGGIADVEISRDDRARPAAHAGEDRDVLLAIWPLERRRLADDAAAALELPEALAVVGIDRAEAAVHRAEEHHVARRH